MPLIIDGNNLLHASMPPSLAGLDEVRLCRLLARGPWARERVTIVCDGAPGPLALHESPEPTVDLIFSGPNRTADTVIIGIIDADSAPRRLTVVSDDREIQRAARRRRARVWACEQMIHALCASPYGNAASPPDADGDVGPLDDHQVERWMRQFGVDESDAKDDQEPWWDAGIDET